MTYFQLFLQNLLIELLVLFLFFHSENKWRLLLAVTLANALTHPWVVFGWLAIPGMKLLTSLILAEIFAIVVEAIIYFKILRKSFKMAFLGSLLANLASWELGPRLSYWVLHRP